MQQILLTMLENAMKEAAHDSTITVQIYTRPYKGYKKFVEAKSASSFYTSDYNSMLYIRVTHEES